MKTLNQLIKEYTCSLQKGEVQLAYKGILEYFGKLRADFIKKYSDYDISSIYQGYMDMSYFSVFTKSLKEKGLKIAIVYLHEKGCFEVWLSARNRETAIQYESLICDNDFDGITVFHDESNPDAIIECTLTSSPDFEDQKSLTDIIEQGTEKFIAVMDLIIKV